MDDGCLGELDEIKNFGGSLITGHLFFISGLKKTSAASKEGSAKPSWPERPTLKSVSQFFKVTAVFYSHLWEHLQARDAIKVLIQFHLLE